jgi:hypothetical protein
MEVRGEALMSLPLFILKKFGRSGYDKWFGVLSPESKKIYQSPINKNDWFPLKTALVEPTQLMCELLFNKSVRGAWECGRYSAEYGLKGIYKVLVKLSTPEVLVKRAGPILMNYYRPGKLEITNSDSNHVSVVINEFPEMNRVIEYRIAGWIERAIEICGSSNVTINITKSLTTGDSCTEYNIMWKKKL